VLRHRIIANFSAEAEGVTTDKIIDKLLEVIPAKESDLEKQSGLPKVTS
jgi:MoxR-like ATPase